MESDEDERIDAELELLQSMYPEQIHYHKRELDYTVSHDRLLLRIPDDYLAKALPEVVVANVSKQDVRDAMQSFIREQSIGEEILDAIILAFNDLVSSKQDSDQDEPVEQPLADDAAKATIIIWLHHLLNTNKRKQCLSPAGSVSGVTKPGYPGVLIYSGPSKAVHEHVNELKQLNWAAFQVRLEIDAEWTFKHGSGVVEVEAMKDVVAELEEQDRDAFLESMKIK